MRTYIYVLTHLLTLTHIKGILSSIIPTVHNCKNDKESPNNVCHNFILLTIVRNHNRCYIRECYKSDAGYSVLEKLPSNAKTYIKVCTAILQQKLNECMSKPVKNNSLTHCFTNAHNHSLTQVTMRNVIKGKPGSKTVDKSKFKRVVSDTLGEYPFQFCNRYVLYLLDQHTNHLYMHTHSRMKTNIKRLLQALKVGDDSMRAYKDKAKGFITMKKVLLEYCSESKCDTVFPFSNADVYGVSVNDMKQVNT